MKISITRCTWKEQLQFLWRLLVGLVLIVTVHEHTDGARDTPRSDSSTSTSTSMPVLVETQSALTSVLSASWPVLLPQISATILKEVSEAVQRPNPTLSGERCMIKS